MKCRSLLPNFRNRYQIVVQTSEVLVFAAAGIGAFLLRFDLSIPRLYIPALFFGLVVWVVVKAIVFRLFRLDRSLWRFVSIQDLLRVGIANLAASAVTTILILSLGPKGFPRSLYLIDLVLCFLGTTGIRVTRRILIEAVAQGKHTLGQRALIYGAGNAGVTLLRETRSNPTLDYLICGFIDDDLTKKDRLIQSVPVFGPGSSLPEIAVKHGIQHLLIAIPSATGAQMTAILARAHAAGLRCKTIPGISELIGGNALARQIRDVSLDDLLSRAPIKLFGDAIRDKIRGKVVMVTGAAGSIGSELCRQIATCEPATLIALDNAETGLYQIDHEICERHPSLNFIPEIGTIQNSARLAEIMSRHLPTVVYHAAAYKHVPMMERHIFEAVENNILGTYNLVQAAHEYAVEDFVLISSDKAVRPANVMGATKRVAELISLAMPHSGSKCVAVRFGNVLGSNGSVVPLFKRQIAAGGPVTVTHPNMRRYFMMISEAVHLVLQASTMGKGGEIFVLDMGQPVNIVALARNLILLSGLRPDEDIKIKFIGVRPGEKLYEELSAYEENTMPTGHEKINIFQGAAFPSERLAAHIEAIQDACLTRNIGQLLNQLKELVPEYNPSESLLGQMFADQSKSRAMKV